MVERELGQHFFVGRGLAGGRFLAHRQLLPVEQDLADLLGRAEVEGLSRRLVGLLLGRHHLLAELVALRLELRGVERDAVPFHAEEHGQDRQFDFLVDEPELLVRLDLRVKNLVQREGAVGFLGGVLRGARDLDAGERDARHTFAGDLVVADLRPAAVALRERGEVAALVHFIHVRLQDRVMHAAREPQAAVGEHVRIEFGVLRDLAAVVALDPGLQRPEGFFRIELLLNARVLVSERQVEGFVAEGERHAYQARRHRLRAHALGVEADERRGFELFYQAF